MQQITILSQYFYPSVASTAQLMTDLAIGFSKRGYTVNVCTGSQSNDTKLELSNQIKINRTVSPIKSRTSILSKISSSIFFILGALIFVIFKQPRNAPLLIASNPPYAGILGICFKLFRNGEYYFLLQDIFPESGVMSGIMQPDSILFNFFSQLIYLTCKYSQNTIVLSSAMQAFLEQKYSNIKFKFQIIENWSIEDIPVCDKQHNKFAKQYNLNETFTVLYSGNMGRLHDIETIVEAARLLRDTSIKFVFIGDGAKTKIIEKAIQNYKLQNILLLPFQPRELISLSLTACDISLVSLIPGSEYIIAPSKLYGMLAAGRGIIAISSPNSYIDQLITNFDCGVNSPPNNALNLANIIRELEHEPLKVKAMGENARQLYENRYRFERALDEYEKLLF